jgi:lipoic acid synthetase
VAHGRPLPPDPQEPTQLAHTVQDMGLNYIVITSVDRDDLRDGGAAHFAACVQQCRALNPGIRIEILVPDFRGKGKLERAMDRLSEAPPDVFNHNLETVQPMYPNVRPGADFQWSLGLLARFRERHPTIPTKSGIMLGLGETREQVEQTLRELRAHHVDMVTIGQYLQPTVHHHPVLRYWTPEEFDELAEFGYALGFSHVASGPLVRSSYHADQSAREAGLVGNGVDRPEPEPRAGAGKRNT